MPTQLEGAMDALITVFHNYSGTEGDKFKLNKGELKQLLNSELTDFLTSQKDPMLVEKIMNDLDSNKDNEVDFNEFVVLVAALTVACNDFFQEQNKKKEAQALEQEQQELAGVEEVWQVRAVRITPTQPMIAPDWQRLRQNLHVAILAEVKQQFAAGAYSRVIEEKLEAATLSP
ncbi:protein S100-Z [Scleropages formosus]|uniref:protein S100-Z n=1 Tax=Scleropages formosus TaxID=113540 RepID=UPI000878A495|nr:protein S100-Z [Scleropages formosus]